MGDELDGLDNNGVNDPATESDTDKIARLETENKSVKEENKSFKDGNSRLGREFKSYKEDNDGKYEQLLEKITELTSKPTGESSNDDLDVNDDDYEMKRVEKIVDARIAKADSTKATTKDKYINDYSKTINGLGKDEDDAIYEAILLEMEGLPGYSDNGVADAERNYDKAERNYYRKLYKMPDKPTAFQEELPPAPAGGASTVDYKEGTEGEVAAALNDPHVQEYMKRRNKTVEDVKKAMANKTPMSGTVRI